MGSSVSGSSSLAASEDEYLGLVLVTVVLEDGVVLVVHGDPLALAEVCDVKHPVGEQLHVRLPVALLVGTA